MGRETEKTKNDLLPGSLDVLILKTLSRQRLHGYAIAQKLRQVSEEVLQVEEGSLYPALQRLQLQGWIKSEWGMTATNRRARFYELTPEGQQQLEVEATKFERMLEALTRVMRTV